MNERILGAMTIVMLLVIGLLAPASAQPTNAAEPCQTDGRYGEKHDVSPDDAVNTVDILDAGEKVGALTANAPKGTVSVTLDEGYAIDLCIFGGTDRRDYSAVGHGFLSDEVTNPAGNTAGISNVAWVVAERPAPEQATVSVEKVVTGNAVPAELADFAFRVSCQEATDDITLGHGDNDSVSYGGDLTNCTVTEADNQAATSTSWQISGDATASGADRETDHFDVTAGGTVTVTFTNTYTTTAPPAEQATAAVTVDKAWVVDGERVADPEGVTPRFDVTLGSSTRTVDAGDPARFRGLDRGMSYGVTVVEDHESLPDPQMFARADETCALISTSMEPSPASVTAPGDIDVTMTNAYECTAVLGEVFASVDVEVEKRWVAIDADDGMDAIDAPAGTQPAFAVTLLDDADTQVGDTVTVDAGGSVTFDQLRDEQTYTVVWEELHAPTTFPVGGDGICTLQGDRSLTRGTETFTAGDVFTLSVTAENVYACVEAPGDEQEDADEPERVLPTRVEAGEAGLLIDRDPRARALMLLLMGAAVTVRGTFSIVRKRR